MTKTFNQASWQGDKLKIIKLLHQGRRKEARAVLMSWHLTASDETEAYHQVLGALLVLDAWDSVASIRGE